MDGTDQATVVLVESDPLIRMALAQYLRDCGYRVIECANGDEARTVMDQPALRIDVVLVNVQLPGAPNGFGLRREVSEKRPSAKTIIFSTPRRAATAVAELCEDGPEPGKHYDHRLIANRIRELLAERRRRTA